ncbi:MAG: CRISPR-associated protein Cas4 [Chloroflexi bacterium]|nr:MAG: CRISPR-associated protein Cas4 [Chloroflexota bacterium]RLC86559.1 MAG: CRISPR-associated protein Cas4 [Chloroflexota bacterium]HEY72592.1 CRISPR-associated protein Cas4 [Thermoflexia bacterium]
MAKWFFGLLALGLLLLWLARRGRTNSGLPQGRVIYTDTGGWNRLERPLFSREFLLTGKPDYLVADGADVIPVEIKSSRAPTHPYPSHILQLAAYCLLVEECYGRQPPYGIIRYADHAFEVDYTPELEEELLATLDDMRDDLDGREAPRNHDEPGRCRACGYRERCDQTIY